MRKRITIYERLCKRRSHEIEVEGAFLLLTQLMISHTEAVEELDITELDDENNRPFEVLLRLLDRY